MSSGIDLDLIRGYYQQMTDREVMRVLTYDVNGLTAEALEVVKEEIKRRKLDFDIATLPNPHQETDDFQGEAYEDNGCPVNEQTRILLEKWFDILLTLFGKENTCNRKVLVAEKWDFPVKYDGSERAAFETLRIVAKQMEVPAESIMLDFYDDNLQRITEGMPLGLYSGKGDSDKFEISLARNNIHDPEAMIATLSHEIAHIKLLGEGRMEENNEPITDLTTIFFGLGIFGANEAFQVSNDARKYGWSTSGYLTQMEWGYALALFAYIRKEQKPEWADYLCINVKADFRRGLEFIAENENKIFQHR